LDHPQKLSQEKLIQKLEHKLIELNIEIHT